MAAEPGESGTSETSERLIGQMEQGESARGEASTSGTELDRRNEDDYGSDALLSPRGKVLAAALVADSVASTASIFDVDAMLADTEYTCRALRRDTLRNFDQRLMEAMPDTPIQDVEVLSSLPKLSRSFGMNVSATWTATEHIVDTDSYLGNVSAVHNVYMLANEVLTTMQPLRHNDNNVAPEKLRCRSLLNKLTLMYHALQDLQTHGVTARRRIESRFEDVSQALRMSEFYPHGPDSDHLSWIEEAASFSRQAALDASMKILHAYKFMPIARLATS